MRICGRLNGGGPVFWAHGSKHSSGVCILVRKGFDLDPVNVITDSNGRYLIIKALVQGETLYMINLYAPNTDKEKSIFFKQLHGVMKQIGITRNDCVIMGGDWNTILDPKIDKVGGVIKTGDTKTLEMKSLLIDLGLVDFWRLKNPTTKRFTYRQRRPLVQSRLD